MKTNGWLYLLIIFFFILTTINGNGQAGLSFSGPTEVCPQGTYQFTVSANNQGCFQFYVIEDGMEYSYGPDAVINSGPLNCGCSDKASSKSFIHTFSDQYPSQVTIKAYFKQIPCVETHSKTWVINKRMNPPGNPYFGDGSLNICAGSTQTVYIEGLDATEEDCYYHHKYTYTAPVGWLINGGSNKLTTFSKNVQITAPISASSGLVSKRELLVETESAWPFPSSSSREFWVGPPVVTNSQITASNAVSAYTFETAKVTAGTAATSYQWSIVPASTSCNGSSTTPYFVNTNSSTATSSVPQIGINYGNCTGTFRIRCNAVNVCGMDDYQDKVVTVQNSSGPCNTALRISPNPNKKGKINMKIVAPCDNEPLQASEVGSQSYFIEIKNSVGETVSASNHTEKDIEYSDLNLESGIYIVILEDSKGFRISKRLVIQ